MKIKEIKINRFKRFTDLTITEIPESTRLVVLVGSNGSGKTSLLEAFNHFHKLKGYASASNPEQSYFEKKDGSHSTGHWYADKVAIEFHGLDNPNHSEIKGKFYFRTAYRNEPDFIVNNLKNQQDPISKLKLFLCSAG